MNLKKHISPHGRTTAVSMMKDEGAYVLEWFAHHMALGFTDILVYTNDCTDGTDKMLMRLEELGLAHHRKNQIIPPKKPQPSAIGYAQKDPIVQDSDWVLVFDADEFLVIKQGDGTIDGLISAMGNYNGLVITWRIFGSGGVTDWSRDPVSEQYLQAAPTDWRLGWGVKTLFKFDHEKWKLGIHRPSMKNKVLDTDYPQTVKWLNGSGLPMEDYFKFRGWRSIKRTVGYDWVQMNHYAVKGIDAYAMRKFRGNVNNKKDKYNHEYWSLQDRNEVPDQSILRHKPAREAVFDELLKDPVLNKLHFEALDAAEARLNAFKATPEYETFKAELLEAGKKPIEDVSAKPPKARDKEKIAALMSDVEKKNATLPKDKRRLPKTETWNALGDIYTRGEIDLSTDLQIEWVPNHEVLLPADPRVLSPNALDLVKRGKLERRNGRMHTQLIHNDDKLLEIGAGFGFFPTLIAKNIPNVEIILQEDRPILIDLATKVIAKNNLEQSNHLRVVADPLFHGDDIERALGLEALLMEHKPTVLRLSDIRMTAKVVSHLDLSSVKRIIRPYWVQNPDPMKLGALEMALLRKGFKPDAELSHEGAMILDRMGSAK